MRIVVTTTVRLLADTSDGFETAYTETTTVYSGNPLWHASETAKAMDITERPILDAMIARFGDRPGVRA